MISNWKNIRAYLQQMDVGEVTNYVDISRKTGICRQSVSKHIRQSATDTIFLDFTQKRIGNSVVLIKTKKEY